MKGLRAKKADTVKEGTLIVAVDIGMVSNHGCCTTSDGRKVSGLLLPEVDDLKCSSLDNISNRKQHSLNLYIFSRIYKLTISLI